MPILFRYNEFILKEGKLGTFTVCPVLEWNELNSEKRQVCLKWLNPLCNKMFDTKMHVWDSYTLRLCWLPCMFTENLGVIISKLMILLFLISSLSWQFIDNEGRKCILSQSRVCCLAIKKSGFVRFTKQTYQIWKSTGNKINISRSVKGSYSINSSVEGYFAHQVCYGWLATVF